MGMELYHRFTEVYLPGQPEVKNDELFSNLINNKIKEFIKQNKISSYRIINCETQSLTSYASELKKGYVMLSVHIAYLK